MADPKSYGFATGFAQGFVPAFNASMDYMRKKELTEIELGLRSFKDKYKIFQDAQIADQQMIEQAKAIAATEANVPQDGGWESVYSMLRAGRTPNQVITDLRSGGTFRKFDEPITLGVSPGTNADEQTETMLQGGAATVEGENATVTGESATATDIRLDANTEGTATSDAKNPADGNDKKGFFDRLFENARQRREDKIQNEIRSMIDLSDDEYDAVIKGYRPDAVSLKYEFVPKAATNSLGPKQKAFNMFLASPEFKGAENKGEAIAKWEGEWIASTKTNGPDTTTAKNRALNTFEDIWEAQGLEGEDLAEAYRGFEASWSTDGGKNLSGKQLSTNILVNSDAFKNASSEEQQDLLAKHEDSWERLGKTDSGKGDTFTPAKLAALEAKYRKDLTSEDPEVKKAAQNWFATEKPALEAILVSTASLGEEADLQIAFYNDENGVQRQASVRPITGQDGTLTYKTAAGDILTSEQIVDVMNTDQAEARTRQITAASNIFRPIREGRTAALVVAEQGRELDRIAARNEAVLTAEGRGASLFSETKKDVLGVLDLIGNLGGKGEDQDSILEQANKRVDGLVEDELITETQAREFKEFNAASIRYIFSAGRALGQQGNGFSNQDYRVISSSIVNSNSYQAFSNNLRRFTRERFDAVDSLVQTTSTDPAINILRELRADAIINDTLVDMRTFYQTVNTAEQDTYDWSQYKVSNPILKVFDTVTEKQAESLPSLKPYVGRGVILYGQQNDPSTYEFEGF